MRAFVAAAVASLIAGASAISAPAHAAPISDRDYIQLTRCAGLTAGADEDAAPLLDAIKKANRRQAQLIQDRGRSARRDASVQMRMSSGETRERLQAERTSRCPALLAAVTAA